MSMNDGLFKCLGTQIDRFLKSVSLGNNRKDQDVFADNSREIVHWMTPIGTVTETSAEKGRE